MAQPLLDLVEVAAVGVERTVGLLVEGLASNRASRQAIVTTRTKVAPERGRDRSRDDVTTIKNAMQRHRGTGRCCSAGSRSRRQSAPPLWIGALGYAVVRLLS